ncbi:hypothetical protein [uncultured Amnibacterium sp.]|uniref:hypothetical protein n=1 Tax=uncultured Amnibacterium sp. TaxID=1631851 RepID=UPI0035C995F9
MTAPDLSDDHPLQARDDLVSARADFLRARGELETQRSRLLSAYRRSGLHADV